MTDRRRRGPAHSPGRWRLLLGIAAVLGMLLGGCSGGGGGAGGGSAPSGDIAHPGGDALILRITTEGGFVAPGALFSQLPGLSVLGDGRVIVPGAVEEIFPGPALPPLQVRRLSEAGIQAVLREVAATGLFADSQTFDGARTVVADAGSTVFSLHAGGRDVTVSVYGLGTLDSSNPPQGVGGAELAAHRALMGLSERLGVLDSWLPAGAWLDAAWQAYAPDAFRLLVRNADADPPDQSGIGNQLIRWPTPADPAAFGQAAAQPVGSRCGVVTGADAAIWLRVLQQANQLTRFTAAEHRYEVTPRPLLPYEPRSCPGS